MKKTIVKTLLLLLIAAMLTACVTGCGASASKSDYATSPAYDDEEYWKADAEQAKPAEAPTSDENSIAGSGGDTAAAAPSDFSEKLIYTATAEIETRNFDESVAAVQSMLDRYGAFLESSYTGGTSYHAQYYGYADYRTASFVIRVPKEHYAELTSGLSAIGNVTSLNTWVENITSQYTDVESRLKTYRTEEERLLAMLEKAETVEDMIAVESRLSEVRYNIESLTSTLRNWDHEVDYSTVNIYLHEVEELTSPTATQRTYGEKLRDGLTDTLSDVGRFFSNLLLWIVSALPVLVILAVVAVVAAILIRRGVRRRRTRPARFDPDTGKPVRKDADDRD